MTNINIQITLDPQGLLKLHDRGILDKVLDAIYELKITDSIEGAPVESVLEEEPQGSYPLDDLLNSLREDEDNDEYMGDLA
jgi:hypothetical protein